MYTANTLGSRGLDYGYLTPMPDRERRPRVVVDAAPVAVADAPLAASGLCAALAGAELDLANAEVRRAMSLTMDGVH